MGDVVQLYHGNGALKAVEEFFSSSSSAALWGEFHWSHPAIKLPDYFLAWLWTEGFKVVPLDADENRSL